MIIDFADKETEKIWNGEFSKRLPHDVQNRAFKKLRQLDTAKTLEDLKIPPSNFLEVLRGNRKGRMSIRINKQWRICFCFENGDAYDVEIVDYH